MQGAARMQEACTAGDMEQNSRLAVCRARYQLYRAGKKIEFWRPMSLPSGLCPSGGSSCTASARAKSARGFSPPAWNLPRTSTPWASIFRRGSATCWRQWCASTRRSRRARSRTFDAADGDGLNFLAGKTMDFIRTQAMDGTLLAHEEGGVPNIILRCGAWTRTPWGS